MGVAIALNDLQFESGAVCGLCIRYRGTGAGLGITPLPTAWARDFVNNRCPECAPGDIDLNIAGDGRWRVEWVATPCDVGRTKIAYTIPVSDPFWASFVISNTAVPVRAVQVRLKETDPYQELARAFNNQWAIHGDWKAALATGGIDVKLTSVLVETVTDKITAAETHYGTTQFEAEGDIKTGAGAPIPGFRAAQPDRSFAA